jgi:hypothetical protein
VTEELVPNGTSVPAYRQPTEDEVK